MECSGIHGMSVESSRIYNLLPVQWRVSTCKVRVEVYNQVNVMNDPAWLSFSEYTLLATIPSKHNSGWKSQRAIQSTSNVDAFAAIITDVTQVETLHDVAALRISTPNPGVNKQQTWSLSRWLLTARPTQVTQVCWFEPVKLSLLKFIVHGFNPKLVGGLEHEFYVCTHLGISSSQLPNSYFSER